MFKFIQEFPKKIFNQIITPNEVSQNSLDMEVELEQEQENKFYQYLKSNVNNDEEFINSMRNMRR